MVFNDETKAGLFGLKRAVIEKGSDEEEKESKEKAQDASLLNTNEGGAK